MTKERIAQIVVIGKDDAGVKLAFQVLDEISEFIKKDNKFSSFARSQAKGGYVSPNEMFLLCYDYLNDSGKYAEYNKKLAKEKADASERKAKSDDKVEKVEAPAIDIFDLNL